MYRAGTDADCLGHHRRRPMGDLTRRIAQRLRHRLLVQRSRQRRDARSSGLVVQQPVDPLRHETLLPAPYGDLALAGLPHDRVGPDAICRQQHDACAPHMLLSAVPIRDDRLQMRTIGAAHFNRDPLAHARSPSLAEHTLVRDSYVRFNPLARRQAARLIILAKQLLFRVNRIDSGLAGSVKRLYFRGDAAFMRLGKPYRRRDARLVKPRTAYYTRVAPAPRASPAYPSIGMERLDATKVASRPRPCENSRVQFARRKFFSIWST